MSSQDQNPDPDAVDEPVIVDESSPRDAAEDDDAPIDAEAEAPVAEDAVEAEVEVDDDPRSAEELVQALAAEERRAQEYLDGLRRERAEFENYRKRSAKERGQAIDRGAEQLVGGLLGVLDNFGYVLAAAQDSPDEQLAKGAEMVHADLLRVLTEAGLEEVADTGVPFDPTVHEAVSQVEADDDVEGPAVAEVLRAGYRFKERVLRPATVTVAQ